MVDKETIIHKKISYRLIYIIYILILPLAIILCLVNYQSYYSIKGIVINKNLLLEVGPNDIKYFINSNKMIINNDYYTYKIVSISDIKITNNYQNYQELLVNLNLDGKYLINNYVIDLKVKKEKKKIISYIASYLE